MTTIRAVAALKSMKTTNKEMRTLMKRDVVREPDAHPDEDKEEVFEQNEHIDDKENEERPIGANNDEWEADRRVHREVSKTIKDIQEEEGEALPTPKEFAPWYPEEEEAGKPK